MQTKFLAIIVLIVIASLSVAGCTVGLPSSSSPTPTPTTAPTVTTPTPAVDYSSHFDKVGQGMGFFLERPFTKSTSMRGNDVYMGSARNTSLPGNKGVTIVAELTKSKVEAKQLYDKYVSNKLNEGYISHPDAVASWKNLEAVWFGATDSYTKQFYAMYYYDSGANSWVAMTQASN